MRFASEADAGGGIRTLKLVRAPAPKTGVFASSTTPALAKNRARPNGLCERIARQGQREVTELELRGPGKLQLDALLLLVVPAPLERRVEVGIDLEVGLHPDLPLVRHVTIPGLPSVQTHGVPAD